MEKWKQEIRDRLERSRLWPRAMTESVKNSILDAELEEAVKAMEPEPARTAETGEPGEEPKPTRAEIRKQARRWARLAGVTEA